MDPTNQGGLYDFLLTALEVRKFYYQRLFQEAIGNPFFSVETLMLATFVQF